MCFESALAISTSPTAIISITGLDLLLQEKCRSLNWTWVQEFGLDLGASSAEHHFIFRRPLLSRFRSLKSLTLRRISVSGEELEYMLHNSPFLEHLLLEIVLKLKEFRVCGSSIALKHLVINFCYGLCSLVVCDTNLVSLRTNEGKKLLLKNAPKLVDVFVSEHSYRPTYSTLDALSWISCCLSNLEAITLKASEITLKASEIDGEWDAAEAGIPQLLKLKQFTIIASVDERNESLMSYTSLIRASPNLEKFTLKMKCNGRTFEVRESKKGVRLPLQHLKVVEFEGCYGSTTEVELVEYFAENAVSLKKIVVDASIHYMNMWGLVFEQYPDEEPEQKVDESAIDLATQQLQNVVPSNVKLVVL